MFARADIRPRHRNAGRPPEKSARAYLQWLRGRACLLAPTGECEGKIEACHFDPWGDKGVGTKVSDFAALPMCRRHHEIQTDRLGWPQFQTRYGFEGRAMVTRYWRAWPGRVAWEREHGEVKP
ncbi:DUF968 domain-containing protein [Sphingomonas abietis]|uniref:DUF968 domain-containing protein n=1 Tax=Sphingomonas abietis TaxID=3012344 RepID=A0ABY7NQZ5_9SPHN|nr:hypothetical protein [Sphingomonas abietis]WBO23974.1 hypothetical protein PBT88_07645 [Sphingomonas abietis]